jgi:hypothetical protein
MARAAEMECAVVGCDKPIRNSRGWCQAHYLRWWRYGDPLGGSTATGAAARYFHDIVLPYHGEACLAWPFVATPQGYGQLWADGRMQLVSRLVCAALCGPPPTAEHQAAHSCGKGHLRCVAPSHLYWATRLENEADKVRHGTRGGKLTATQVREVRSLIGTMSQAEIARQFSVIPSVINCIHKGRTFTWVR